MGHRCVVLDSCHFPLLRERAGDMLRRKLSIFLVSQMFDKEWRQRLVRGTWLTMLLPAECKQTTDSWSQPGTSAETRFSMHAFGPYDRFPGE